VIRELEFIGDGLRKVADSLCDANVEARMKLTRRGQAAGNIGRFKNDDTLTRVGKVSGAYQSVMACTDNDGVVLRQAYLFSYLFCSDSGHFGKSGVECLDEEVDVSQ
jgi:hypothetical protein